MLKRFLLSEEGWIENKIEACSICADCYRGLGRERSALDTLLRSMSLTSRERNCAVKLGNIFWNMEITMLPFIGTKQH